ncbi:MATE family efflux transporter [Flavobacterium sp. ASW18X]|uniref:MATE family efflux transporter n=1 Tax=Flavobacterium sp. ASW18X TaxID=2572595 RepID=UPI00351661E7
MLYFRMILNLFITLYTSRLILEYLGVVDYGIYNVVGGLVSMFSVVSGSLSNAVSRFLAFELGKENWKKLKNIFSMSFTIHFLLAIIILALVQILGAWFLNNEMNIPTNRLEAANWVLLFSSLTFSVNLLNIPFNAAIVANEKMDVFSYISILEVLLKLIIVVLLGYATYDSLVLYAILLFGVSLLLTLIYVVYANKTFREVSLKLYWDKIIFNEIIGFASWNFLGVLANIFKTQGIVILLNLFWGATVNAAQGISVQVSNAIQRFADNFIMAVNPQIIKSYAKNDMQDTLKLVSTGSRLSFFLLLVLSFPVLTDTYTILELWLKKVPPYTVMLVRLVLINSLIEVFSKPIITLINATGRIKYYQIGISILLFLNFPFSYLILKLGGRPSHVYLVYILISSIALLFRFIFLKNNVGINISTLFTSIFKKAFLVFLIATVLFGLNNYFFNEGWFRLCTSTILCVLLILISIIFFGLAESERMFIKNILIKKIKK